MMLFLLGNGRSLTEIVTKWWFTKCRGATTSVVTFIPILALLISSYITWTVTTQTMNLSPAAIYKTDMITIFCKQSKVLIHLNNDYLSNIRVI